MTVDELKTLGIPLPSFSEIDVLYIEGALEWILQNTDLTFDKANLDEVKALPAGAKLFTIKYRELMCNGAGVTSESVDGLSQSFSDSLKEEQLREYASSLLGEYMPQIRFTPASKRWDEGRGCFVWE